HQFVSVKAEENDPNNVTIDSIESIVLTEQEAQQALASQEEQQQAQTQSTTTNVSLKDAGTEGTELLLPGVFVDEDSDGEDDEQEENSTSEVYIEDTVPVERAVPRDPEGAKKEKLHVGEVADEKKEEVAALVVAAATATSTEAEVNKSTAKENSMVVLLDDDDDDDITDKQPETGTTTAAVDGPRQRVERAAGAFVQAITCTAKDMQNCAALPGNFGSIAMPVTACQPIINKEAAKNGKAGKRSLEDATTKYNDLFAVQFLNELLNEGFTLLHHVAVDEDEDWIGRTVNLNFKPGVCTAKKIVGPAVQWTTMGGGKEVNGVETESVALFEIDAITVSNISSEMDPISNQEYEDELDCFFSITSKHGDVYMFEALSSEEAHKIVSGIRNISFRMSSQVIGGDSKAVADFFDNSQEPEETHLRKNAAMLKISNAYLDDVL
ncbi:MAG: hypothetical protein SGILL_005676, partial [Bacillariaceae sp.]